MEGGDSSYLIKLVAGGFVGGNRWDEKGNTKVVQIFISHHGEDIKSIQFQCYAENGNLELSRIYGSEQHYPNFDAVKLDYPAEYITGISWSLSNSYIRSITFHTNLGEYGPIGQLPPTNSGKVFNVRLGKDRQFGGFYGTSDGSGLKSIGVYLKPIMNTDYSQGGNIVVLTEDAEH